MKKHVLNPKHASIFCSEVAGGVPPFKRIVEVYRLITLERCLWLGAVEFTYKGITSHKARQNQKNINGSAHSSETSLENKSLPDSKYSNRFQKTAISAR